jgi:hypothetical protein
VSSDISCFARDKSKKRLDNLYTSLRVNGLTARVHGNVHRKPKHALSFSSIEYVVRFLLTYSEEHSVLLPGRIPGYKRSDIQLLPSSTTKRAVWRVYSSAAEAVSTIHVVAYSTFCFIWRTLVPSIVVLKPRSDLCWQCQQNSASIIRTSNTSGAEKTTAISNALEHLRIVKLERSYYKSVYDECKESLRAHYVTDGKFTPPPNHACSQTPCNSVDIYSFDYAQQVHYPSNPLQPGPIYIVPDTEEVHRIRCQLRGPPQANQLPDR